MLTPSGMFDPALYATVRRPTEHAFNLPRWCYVEPAFFDREIDRVFRKEWLCVARK